MDGPAVVRADHGVGELIPACWAEHGALVEELTLFWSRHAAFEGDKPGAVTSLGGQSGRNGRQVC